MRAAVIHDVQRMLELLIALVGKADDDVCRYPAFRDGGLDPVKQRAVLLDAVAAAHPPEHVAVAGLHRQMDKRHDVITGSDRFDHLIAEVPGMRCGEADPVDPRLRALPQQRGKSACYAQIFAIGVDILSQQGHFPIPLRLELAQLLQDIFHGAAAFFSSGIWHDAVGAELIAAIHDVDPCLVAAEPAHRQVLDDLSFLGEDLDASFLS